MHLLGKSKTGPGLPRKRVAEPVVLQLIIQDDDVVIKTEEPTARWVVRGWILGKGTRAGQTHCIRPPLQRFGPVNVAMTFMMGTVSGSK